jgi:hypothetical protein
MTCKSGAPTQDGGKFSSTRKTNSSTGRAERDLTLKAARMLKATQLEYGATMEAELSNGMSSISTKLRAHKPRE